MLKLEPAESPKQFLLRAAEALLRIVVMVVFGAVHWIVNHLIHFIVPANIPKGGIWLEDVSFVFFSLVYVAISWDTLKVFAPRLQAHDYPGTEPHESR